MVDARTTSQLARYSYRTFYLLRWDWDNSVASVEALTIYCNSFSAVRLLASLLQLQVSGSSYSTILWGRCMMYVCVLNPNSISNKVSTNSQLQRIYSCRNPTSTRWLETAGDTIYWHYKIEISGSENTDSSHLSAVEVDWERSFWLLY